MRKSLRSIIGNVFLWFFSIVGAISLLYLVLLLVVNLSYPIRTAQRKDFVQETSTATPVDLATNFPETNDEVLELFLSPPQCTLPCWWGFVPGKSTLTEMKAFLDSYASNGSALPATDGKSSLAMFQVGGQEVGLPTVNFGFQDEVLTNITFEEFRQGFTNPYVLPEILNEYGPPQKICALPFDEKYTIIRKGLDSLSAQENSDYSRLILLMLYPEKGMEITYKFKASETCCALKATLRPAESIRLVLQEVPTYEPPHAEYTCADKQYDLGQFVSGQSPPGSFRPIDQVTDLNVDMFYKRFSEMRNGQDWIQVSTKAWRTKDP